MKNSDILQNWKNAAFPLSYNGIVQEIFQMFYNELVHGNVYNAYLKYQNEH